VTALIAPSNTPVRLLRRPAQARFCAQLCGVCAMQPICGAIEASRRQVSQATRATKSYAITHKRVICAPARTFRLARAWPLAFLAIPFGQSQTPQKFFRTVTVIAP
jgi:hypothetical protein